MTRAVACERCGAGIMAGARFCASCGADISDQQGLIATTPVLPPGTLKAALLDRLRDATLGDYEVLIELGSGGMASVFLAHDLQLDRKVAIKVMHPQLLEGEGMVERFRLEARTVAALSHPHIVPIFAVRHAEDLFLFIMKFVEGQPLDGILRQQAPLPAPMVRYLLSRVAEALGYAHRQGVIHRDVKPANIMVDIEGNPVVMDFGIAKVANREALTQTGAAIGTPIYMSPEQCQTLALTGASDQYSLGIMAYEMVAGKPPFPAGNPITLMFKHVHETPRPLLEVAPDCPPDLAATIDRMLAKAPEERFARMEEVVRALAAPTLAHDDPVRVQLIQFAMAGENRRLLKRVSTPRSPIPTAPSKRSAAATARVGGTQRPASTPRQAVSMPAPRSRFTVPVVLGALALAVGVSGLAIFKPWQDGVAAPVQDPPAVTDSGGAGSGVVPEPIAAPAVAPAVADTAASPPAAVSAESTAAGSAPTEPARRDSAPPRRPTVPPPAPANRPVSRLAVTRTVRVIGPAALSVNEPAVLEAVPLDSAGKELPGRAAAWSSSDAEVLSINRAGAVIGRQSGRAVITATIDGVSGSLAIQVRAPEPTGVTVAPTALRLDAGATAIVAATVQGAPGRAVTWTSSAPQVASVDSDGMVTARAAGSAVITAAVGDLRASSTVTVLAAGPTAAELRAQVVQAIRAYAGALEAKDVTAVRRLYPGMTERRERELRASLPNLRGLQVRLDVTDVQLSGDDAIAIVTGTWDFTADGRRTQLPANNTYVLVRRNDWIITEIR